MGGIKVPLHSGGAIEIDGTWHGNGVADLMRAVTNERDREFLVALGRVAAAFTAGESLAHLSLDPRPEPSPVAAEVDLTAECGGVDPDAAAGERSVLVSAITSLHRFIVDELDSDPLPHPADYLSDPDEVRLVRELVEVEEEADDAEPHLEVVEDDVAEPEQDEPESAVADDVERGAPSAGSAEAAILAVLDDAPMRSFTAAEIDSRCDGFNYKTITGRLTVMTQEGKVERVSRGVYRSALVRRNDAHEARRAAAAEAI